MDTKTKGVGNVKFKKKRLVVGALFLVLSGCSMTSTKTYPSVSLPYEIVDEEVGEIKDRGLEEYTEKQTLEKITVREITPEENERFLERMHQNTLKDLNQEYSAVEFYYGDVTRIDVNGKAFGAFDSSKTNFIYDDVYLLDELYQLVDYDVNESLLTGEKSTSNRDIGYGSDYKGFKNVVLIKTEYIEKGLQLKTIIEDEEVYFDIK